MENHTFADWKKPGRDADNHIENKSTDLYPTSDTIWHLKYEASNVQMLTEAQVVLCTICVSGSDPIAEVDLRRVSGWLLTTTKCVCVCVSLFVRVCERVGTVSKGTNHRLRLEQRRDTVTQMIVISAEGGSVMIRIGLTDSAEMSC